MSKKPTTTVYVEYVTAGGSQTIPCEPIDGKVTVEGETFMAPHSSIFLRKGKPTCVCVQGNAVALPVWATAKLGSRELDGIAHNNLLAQLFEGAGKKNAAAASWLMLGAIGLVFIAVIGVAFKVGADVEDAHEAIRDLRVELVESGGLDVSGDTSVDYGPGFNQQQQDPQLHGVDGN